MSLKRCNTSIIGDPPKTQKKFEEEEKEVLRIFAKKRSYQLIPLQCVDDRIRVEPLKFPPASTNCKLITRSTMLEERLFQDCLTVIEWLESYYKKTLTTTFGGIGVKKTTCLVFVKIV